MRGLFILKKQMTPDSGTWRWGGGGREIQGLAESGRVTLVPENELKKFSGRIVLTGASPVSAVMAKHEIDEVVAYAKQCPNAQIVIYLVPGSEADKDVSKLTGRQGDRVADVVVDMLHKQNEGSNILERYLNTRGFSIHQSARYLRGRDSVPAISLYDTKTPKRTILAAPSAHLEITNLTQALQILGLRGNLAQACHARNVSTLAELCVTASLTALNTALVCSKLNPDMVSIFTPFNQDSPLVDKHYWEIIRGRALFGMSPKAAIASLTCVDCTRQAGGALTKHNIGRDYQVWSRGGKRQQCRDASTILTNNFKGPLTDKDYACARLIADNSVFPSGIATLAIMLMHGLEQDTIFGLRDFPNARETYRDVLRIIGERQIPPKVIITPSSNNSTDSPFSYS